MRGIRAAPSARSPVFYKIIIIILLRRVTTPVGWQIVTGQGGPLLLWTANGIASVTE